MSTRSIHTRVAVVLAALSLFGPTIGHADSFDVSGARSVRLSELGLDNFGRVNDAYYRGAAPDDDQYDLLAAAGIKTIVDLRSDDIEQEDRLLVERAGMQYVHIPMTTRQPPTPPVVETFLKVVTETANQPVYVHCVGGRHRTGVMTAVYRMTHDRWTAEQAFKEMKQFRFGADFLHPEFKRFVYAYHADPIPGTKSGE